MALGATGAALCLPLSVGDAASFPGLPFADGRYFARVAPADVLNPARCLLEPRWPAPRQAWQEAAACGQAAFYSLMSEGGPELTLCAMGDTVQLVTTPPRTRLDARFAPHVRAFLEQTRLHLSRTMVECGVIEAGGRYYHVFNLPEGLRLEKSLNVSSMPLTVLPAGLVIEQDLDVSHTPLARLPERLKVGGDLWLMGTAISSLPPSAKVGGKVVAPWTPPHERLWSP